MGQRELAMPNRFNVSMRLPDRPWSVGRSAAVPVGEDGVLGYDSDTGLPRFFKAGANVTIDVGVISTSVPVGPKGDKGDKGDQGDDGESFLPTPTTEAARSITTSFTVSATRAALCTYVVRLTATNPLLAGSAQAKVALQISTDGGSSWRTVASASARVSIALSVTVQLTNEYEHPLTALVPAGAMVRLSPTISGSAGVVYVSSCETLL